MQRIAQAATLENQRLRSLLSVHGVSRDEVDRYISSPSVPSPRTPSNLYEPGTFKCKACGSTSIMLEIPPAILLSRQPHGRHNFPQNAVDCPVSSSSTSPETIQHPYTIGADTAAFTSPRAKSTAACDPDTECNQEKSESRSYQSQENHQAQSGESRLSEDDNQDGDKSLEAGPSLATSHHDSHYISESVNHVDAMETSCDTAASILVDLHHHVDPERARAALGCKGSNSCTVNNIKIFQLLEKFP